MEKMKNVMIALMLSNTFACVAGAGSSTGNRQGGGFGHHWDEDRQTFIPNKAAMEADLLSVSSVDFSQTRLSIASHDEIMQQLEKIAAAENMSIKYKVMSTCASTILQKIQKAATFDVPTLKKMLRSKEVEFNKEMGQLGKDETVIE